jgi:hypothetical protein
MFAGFPMSIVTKYSLFPYYMLRSVHLMASSVASPPQTGSLSSSFANVSIDLVDSL